MAKKHHRPSNSKAEVAKRKAAFVEHYLQGVLKNATNGKAAAIAAGFAPRSAEVTAVRLLKDPWVKAEVERRRAEVVAQAKEATALTAEETLRSLARDIRFDPGKLFNDDGSMKKLHEMDEDTRLALRGAEIDEIVAKGEVDEELEGQEHGGALKRNKGSKVVVGHTVKVKFPEKTAAREQAMKHFGLYELDNKQKPGTQVNVGVLTVPAEALNFDKVRARALKAA